MQYLCEIYKQHRIYWATKRNKASSSQINTQSYLMQALSALGSSPYCANVSIPVCITDYSEPEGHASDNLI